MAAPRLQTPISLTQIHQVTGGELVGSPDVSITSLASLTEARSTDLSFVTADRLLKTNESIQAGALLAHRRPESPACVCPCRSHVLLPDHPFSRGRVEHGPRNGCADRFQRVDLARRHHR